MIKQKDVDKYQRSVHAILVATETPQAAENTAFVIRQDVIDSMME